MKKLPVSWIKDKGIELAVGDELFYNLSPKGQVIIKTKNQADIFNSRNDNWHFITSFADRQNPGKQPVADWVPVDYICPSGAKGFGKLNLDWSLTDDIGDIKYWKPNFDALHEIYEKETAMQKPVNDPDQYLARECVKESTSAVADDGQVFTQAEIPPAGLECEVRIRHLGQWMPWCDGYFKIGYDSKIWIYADGADFVYPAHDVEFRPIDTRTNKEKAADEHWNSLKGYFAGTTTEALVKTAFMAGVKWVGE